MSWQPTPRDDQTSGWESITCRRCGHIITVRGNTHLIPDMDEHEQQHNPAWRQPDE